MKNEEVLNGLVGQNLKGYGLIQNTVLLMFDHQSVVISIPEKTPENPEIAPKLEPYAIKNGKGKNK